MKLKFKNNFWGYFNFYYGVTGNRIWVYIFLSICVGFLDGMGLAMFMPLLQAAGGGSATGGGTTKEDHGAMANFTHFIQSIGFPLTINVVLVLMVILFFAKGVIKFVQLNYGVSIQHSFMRKVRFVLIDRLQGLTYKGFLKLDAGRIQNTLVTETQRLFQTMVFYFNAIQAMVMLLSYIALAFLANWQFAFLVASGAALSNFVYRKIQKETKKASLEVSKKGNDFNGYLIQAINHFKYLKSTGYFISFRKKINSVIVQTENLNKKMGFYAAFTTSSREPLIIIIVAIVIYIQINLIGSKLPSILLSLLLFYRALMSLMQVQNYWQFFVQNIGSMETIASLANEMAEVQEDHQPAAMPVIKDGFELKNLEFSYGTNRVLNGINLKIEKNKTIALVGESGSGKTTLANIFSGLIPPDNGEILIDSQPLTNFDIDSYRSKIGYISQEAVIFNDDLYNNITFWAEPTEANLKRFWEIVELASLTDFVKAQPNQEHTMLGDNGLLISGGQKQRISIARELYKDIEILIMDEATSALDSETERVIKENMEKLYGSYTMIIVAHRISTIKNADVIYLLNNGNVTASGTFNELVDKSDQFKYIVSLQSF